MWVWGFACNSDIQWAMLQCCSTAEGTACIAAGTVHKGRPSTQSTGRVAPLDLCTLAHQPQCWIYSKCSERHSSSPSLNVQAPPLDYGLPKSEVTAHPRTPMRTFFFCVSQGQICSGLWFLWEQSVLPAHCTPPLIVETVLTPQVSPLPASVSLGLGRSSFPLPPLSGLELFSE